MKSYFYHAQINIDFKKNSKFYKDLMNFLGWEIIFADNATVGYKSGTSGDLWFTNSQKLIETDYDAIGVNHISIRVESQKDVDDTIAFLKTKNIPTLFDTPRHRPDFVFKDTETYYQIIFESPDKIQFEVVYIGPK